MQGRMLMTNEPAIGEGLSTVKAIKRNLPFSDLRNQILG